ncbi:MAG: energy transducer TonB [Deltaproteobacteria bacterium]|nr:energy transducer TonB [Deltaproteobacteria bacterium]
MGRRHRHRTTAAALSVAFVCMMHGSARADEDDPPPATEPQPEEPVAPPRLLTNVTPVYPEGEEGEAYVIVAVTVGATGAVDAVRVVEGLEPFASRAVEAVYLGRFAPATRGGKPIAAVIRFRVDFTKVAAPPPTPPAPPVATTGVKPAQDEGAEAKEEEKVDDVLVRGGKSAIGAGVSDTISKTEVRQLPGAFGDPFRAIEVSTGVTPIISGLPYFYVRGAPPGNVGYYFDGVRVPYLFHFGLGPSVVHPALVARTDIHKGGYPAALGRFAGGIVDSASLPPSTRVHGEGQLRVIDAGALLEVPFADGKGAVLAGGRYAYTAALVGLIRADTKLDYRDYQLRVAYQLGNRDTVTLFTFGAYDLASQRVPVDESSLAAAGRVSGPVPEGATVERVLFASEFHRVDARWDHALGYGGKMRVAATLGYDRTRLEARRSAQDLMTAARFEIVQPVSKRVLLRGGADVVVDRYLADALTPYADDDDVVARQAKIFADRTDYAAGIRLDAVLLLDERMEVTPGIRLDRFESGGVSALGVDPRISARFAVTKKVRVVHAYGIATQPPSTPLALPAITIARLEGGLQRSAQASAGVEVDLPEDMSATATVFHNAFFDLNDALGTAQLEIIDIEKSDSLVGKARGQAFGLELGLRRKLSRRVGGLVAYTLSRSLRTLDGRTFLSAYDRAHVFNAAVSVDLGRSWRAGGRFVIYSGVPYAPVEAAFPGQVVGIPPERTPPFVRLDLRIEKRWRVGQNGWVSFVVEALNATLTREVTGYRCTTGVQFPGAPPPVTGCSERIVGPIAVPSIGVEGGF